MYDSAIERVAVPDIKSMRHAAAAGAQRPAPVDPANPMRAMSRLPPQDQMTLATEFGA